MVVAWPVNKKVATTTKKFYIGVMIKTDIERIEGKAALLKLKKNALHQWAGVDRTTWWAWSAGNMRPQNPDVLVTIEERLDRMIGAMGA